MLRGREQRVGDNKKSVKEVNDTWENCVHDRGS